MPKRKLLVAAPAEEATSTMAWSDYNVVELKLELDARGLAKSGRKGDLVARLEAADNRAPPADEAAPKPKRTKKLPVPDGERRLRPFEAEPDETYKKKLKKVHKERMFMLDRTRILDRDGYACEKFDIAGSTGNIYQTTIGRKPSCTCMDAVCL